MTLFVYVPSHQALHDHDIASANAFIFHWFHDYDVHCHVDTNGNARYYVRCGDKLINIAELSKAHRGPAADLPAPPRPPRPPSWWKRLVSRMFDGDHHAR